MKTITISSLPFKSVIKEMAKALQTPYKMRCDEYHIDLPDTWGSGFIKGINFREGLGLIIYSCTFHDDVEMRFSVNEVHPLKYLFCLSGQLRHRFMDNGNEHLLDRYQNSIVASEATSGHVLTFRKGVFTEIYSIEIDRKKFEPNMRCEIDKSKLKFYKIFNDTEAAHQFFFKGLYSLNLALIFQEITDFEHRGLIRKIFLKGKVNQILAHQLIQYDDQDKKDANRSLLLKSEVKSILEAIVIIEGEIDSLDSIQKIAHRVGLNGNKIQNGFQSLYGMTVNNYIQKTRLELAKNLLLNTQYSIQEIMARVGWTSKSYFSKVFKDNFELTPSNYRKKYDHVL